MENTPVVGLGPVYLFFDAESLLEFRHKLGGFLLAIGFGHPLIVGSHYDATHKLVYREFDIGRRRRFKSRTH